MQQFSHDYTKVSEALKSLYSATRFIANDCYDAALQRINEARTILSEYLAQDNMIPDNDVADGWVRHSEAQAELENLRSRVGDTHRSAPDGSPGFSHPECLDGQELPGKIPRTLFQAQDIACTTDCARYRQGDCPFFWSDKVNCPRIRYYMHGYDVNDSDEDLTD